MVEPKSPHEVVADPPQAPTAMVLRIVAAERDYVDGHIGIVTERLNGMDTASKLLSDTVNRTPTEITREVNHLQSIMDERFASIETQFKERDTRAERESRDNKVAVDAAFAAQKEAASEQNKGNNLAIDKSEKATAETIKTNQELAKSEINGLRKSGEDGKVRQTEVDDDMKKRLGAVEASLVGLAAAKQNATETRVDRRGDSTVLLSLIAALLILVQIGVVLYVSKK